MQDVAGQCRVQYKTPHQQRECPQIHHNELTTFTGTNIDCLFCQTFCTDSLCAVIACTLQVATSTVALALRDGNKDSTAECQQYGTDDSNGMCVSAIPSQQGGVWRVSNGSPI